MLLLLLYYCHMEYIWRIMGTGRNGTLDLDLDRHSSEARIALVPPVSVKDQPLHWILGRS